MENICNVTEHLKKKITAEGGDISRETLTVVPTTEGEVCYKNNEDAYFKIHRENHNLDRARNQFALVLDIEKNSRL